MGPEPALIARDLERSFGSGKAAVRVLCDVTLELYAGQVLLLMGPSGSGKSTLLAVLSGLLRPEQGDVKILGSRPVADERSGPRAVPAAPVRLRVPGLQPVPVADSPRAVGDGGALGRRSLAIVRPAAASRRCSTSSGFGPPPTYAPTGFPAVRNSAWRWAGRCSSGRSSASPTSRPARSTGGTASR